MAIGIESEVRFDDVKDFASIIIYYPVQPNRWAKGM
jgi:hypothetical protein